jgi:hypothetical protein
MLCARYAESGSELVEEVKAALAKVAMRIQ